MIVVLMFTSVLFTGCFPPPQVESILIIEHNVEDEFMKSPSIYVTNPVAGVHKYQKNHLVYLSVNSSHNVDVESWRIYDSYNNLVDILGSSHELKMSEDYKAVANLVCLEDSVCFEDYSCVNNECVLVNHAVVNKKNTQLYSNKETFLISSSNWRDVLQILPVVVWTQQQEDATECQRGYMLPENVCVYPKLIWHEENSSSGILHDIDSIYNFFNQYDPSKISYFGELPQDVLEALHEFDVEPMLNFLDYWEDFSDFVYVKDDYGLALLASTYASLINAPLLIENYNDDVNFSQKNIICIGINSYYCNEEYTREELEELYLQKTSTTKLVLVNHEDINVGVNNRLGISLEKTSGNIEKMYFKLSLNSPYLASAKKQLILSTNHTDYASVNNFVKDKINNFNIIPEYLTIIASPNIIPFARNDTDIHRDYIQEIFGERIGKWIQVDNSLYADLNDDYYQDFAVGRIFSFTTSDVSSYISRVIFYDDLPQSNDFAFLTSFSKQYASPYHRNLYGAYLLLGSGLNDESIYTEYGDSFEPDVFRNKLIISYSGHGSRFGFVGANTNFFRQNQIWLNNTMIASGACSTCAYNVRPSNSMLFCSEMIRRGAIAYVGATDTVGHNTPVQLTFMYWLSKGKDIGNAFKDATNSHFSDRSYKYSPHLILLGDPTFNPNIPISDSEDVVKLQQSEFIPITYNSLIKTINITLLPTQVNKLTNLKNSYYTHLDLNSPVYYGGKNTFQSYIYYFNQTKDQGAQGGFELESYSGELIITFKFENPNNYTLTSVRNAKITMQNNVIDITNQLVYDPVNPFAKPVFLINNEGISYVYVSLKLNQDNYTLVDINTTQIPLIDVYMELEFNET